jgi:hypothetical protein
MFLQNSRYFQQPVVDALSRNGSPIRAISLRRLPPISGDARIVKGNDQLDIIAQRQYNDPTWFWHIADANTDLEANNLVKETLRVIIVPRQ